MTCALLCRRHPETPFTPTPTVVAGRARRGVEVGLRLGRRFDAVLTAALYGTLLLVAIALAGGLAGPWGAIAGFACALAARGLIDLWRGDVAATG